MSDVPGAVLDQVQHPPVHIDVLAVASRLRRQLVEALGALHDITTARTPLRTAGATGPVRRPRRSGCARSRRPDRLTPRGAAVLEDDLVHASYKVFAGFHTGLYREMPQLLAGAAAAGTSRSRGR